MLIIPIRDERTPRGPAYITALLVLINVIVFFGFQLHDDEAMQEAVSYYQKSSLPDTEFPRYVEFLEQKGDPVQAGRMQQALDGGGKEGFAALFSATLGDGDWQQALATGTALPAQAAARADWQRDRAEYEKLLQKNTVWAWGSVPARHDWLRAFTSMFLHGGLDHLLGNMLFLALLGYLVEPVLGAGRFLVFYLLGGFGAEAFFTLLHANSGVPLVGASGAIAAVMGMYALLYGMRKIRFFYWVGIFFGYWTAPALLLFPFWVLKEVVEFWVNAGKSSVAYEAHIGGLLTGALLAFGFRLLHGNRVAVQEQEQVQAESRQELLERARERASALDFVAAVGLYLRFLEAEPGRTDLLPEAWRAARHAPPEVQHRVAALLLKAVLAHKLPVQAGQVCFEEYRKATAGKIRLQPDVAVRLALTFAKQGQGASAEVLLLALRGQPGLEGSEQAWLALVLGWRRQGQADRARACERYLRQTYPASQVLEQLAG